MSEQITFLAFTQPAQRDPWNSGGGVQLSVAFMDTDEGTTSETVNVRNENLSDDVWKL